MSGILYLCATPIGNLEDMTFRAVRVLQEADLIAAEDTRNSIRLLNHFEIHTPMTSYHEHNKYEKAEELIGLLAEGRNIALITDAGMPGISDPGEVLCRRAHEEGIPVTIVPGACAAVSALAVSGLPSGHFCFEGFLPRTNRERKERLTVLAKEERTMIVYEAPHRIRKTLQDLCAALGEEREIGICRELTKKHEEILRMTLAGAEAFYRDREPKGEFVLVIRGRSAEESRQEQRSQWEEMELEEHLKQYLDKGLDRKEAMKRVAADRGISKRDVYQALNVKNGEQ